MCRSDCIIMCNNKYQNQCECMCAHWHHCRTFKSCDYVVGLSVLADKLAYTHTYVIIFVSSLLLQLHSLIPTNLRASPHRRLLMLALCPEKKLCPCSLTQTFTKTNGLVTKLDIQMCKYYVPYPSFISVTCPSYQYHAPYICPMPLISLTIISPIPLVMYTSQGGHATMIEIVLNYE